MVVVGVVALGSKSGLWWFWSSTDNDDKTATDDVGKLTSTLQLKNHPVISYAKL